LLGIDNVFYGGDVVDGAIDTGSADSLQAIRKTSELVLADERVVSVMVGIRDGITLALKL
jgi:predicted O-methyltransferase YrrM